MAMAVLVHGTTALETGLPPHPHVRPNCVCITYFCWVLWEHDLKFYHLSAASIYHLLSSFTCVCYVLNNSLKTKSMAVEDGSGEPIHSWDRG